MTIHSELKKAGWNRTGSTQHSHQYTHPGWPGQSISVGKKQDLVFGRIRHDVGGRSVSLMRDADLPGHLKKLAMYKNEGLAPRDLEGFFKFWTTPIPKDSWSNAKYYHTLAEEVLELT